MNISNENIRLYVIGDIHGRLDLLDRLIAAIDRDAKGYGADCLTVTLGDYVDRGPNSRGVLDRLSGKPFPCDYVALKGNHEALLEAFLIDPSVGAQWWRLGGLETLHSFGVRTASFMGRRNFAKASKQLRTALSEEHSKFLASLKTSITVGRYFMCHAGVRPGIPLESQNEDDLLWIRDEFLGSKIDFGKIVIHGHTPTQEPEVWSNRINIDTCAFASGRLTCVVLEGERHRFITA
jgi:serine/threonine protein phosphatase 1